MASIVGIPLSKVSPAFLHANSTSHTWVFSAFAEIIDNAYDPDVSASELLIDQIDIRDMPCLIFLDNGAGMDRDHLLKMLSFGFCEKDIYERQGSHQPIGHYGNGFKSGSMRIGLDALVFTRCQHSASIGFLSQTYLKAINADCVVVPILEYRLPKLERIKSQESRNNLNAILQYSVFKFEEELKAELRALEGSKTGTKIIISNLKRLQDGTLELDFSSDNTDIRCPEAHEADLTSVYHRPIQHNTSEYKRSLREYCSILFLRPRMKITIRGVRVKSKLVSKSLSNTEIDMYKPTWLSRPVKIIFGFTCETDKSEDYGMMLYHRNRLIKAYEKVGYQKQPNELGVGVVGVAQVDFLQPIHNKQDFNKDEKFNSVMLAFSNKLNDYWNEKKGQQGASLMQQGQRILPDWLWAQCDQCLKWRRIPDGIDGRTLPDQWYCRLNPDATHNRCDIPEEPEDEDLAVKPTYEKTFKKKIEERKRLRIIEMEKEDEIKKRRIIEKERELKEKELVLRAFQSVAATAPAESPAFKALQTELALAKKREEQQKMYINQIEKQKKQMEEQRISLIKMAENLKTKKSKEALEQMNQILESMGSSIVKQAETLPQTAVRKNRTVGSIKTETGEVLSITQNDINGYDDNDDGVKNTVKSSICEQTVSVRSLIKEKNSVESTKKSSGQPQNRSEVKPQNGFATKKPDAQPESQTSRQQRQRRRAEKVLAVIDLTSDKEYGELVDVKPSLNEIRLPAQDNLQSEDRKPDKDHLNVAVKKKVDGVKEKSQTANAAVRTKKEIIDSIDSETKEKKKLHNKETERYEDEPMLSSDVPANLDDNLEAAMEAIKKKLEKEDSRKNKKWAKNSESPSADSNIDIKKESEAQGIINRLEESIGQASHDDMEEGTDPCNDNSDLFYDPAPDDEAESPMGDNSTDDVDLNSDNLNAVEKIPEPPKDNILCSNNNNINSEQNNDTETTSNSDTNNHNLLNNENQCTVNETEENVGHTHEYNNCFDKDSADHDMGSSEENCFNEIVDKNNELFFSRKSTLGSVNSESSVEQTIFSTEHFLNDNVGVGEDSQDTSLVANSFHHIKRRTLVNGSCSHCADPQNYCASSSVETQTFCACSSIDTQTDCSACGTECDLKEKLALAEQSLEDTKLKLTRFHKDVYRLLKFNFSDLALGDTEDIEKVVQNLIELKQEASDQPQTNGEL